MPMLILLTVWQFGAPMVIFLAGLKQIPQELYEAASVDGAGASRKFLKITLPMLSPVIFFNLLLETIHAFQIFASAFIISNGTGGPAGSTLFYTLYLYFRGFQDFQMGYASAMAWILVIVVGVITAVFFWSSKHWVHYSGEGEVMSTIDLDFRPHRQLAATARGCASPTKNRKRGRALVFHVCSLALIVIVLYPAVWMLMSSFKPSSEIVGNVSLIPTDFTRRPTSRRPSRASAASRSGRSSRTP